MRICLIASCRFPIREPFQGGLEAHTATLAERLRRRGHEVSVFAAPGSDPRYATDYLEVGTFEPSPAARADVGAMPDQWMREHHAYLKLMLHLAHGRGPRPDVIHNNSLHHLPIAMSTTTGIPMVSTLHTPPIPWLESAIELGGRGVTFTAVSRHTARSWRHLTDAAVVPNGIDTDRWRPGPGGGPVVWAGRLVPEKAPHLAILAARRAGLPIVLAGPVLDRPYFDEHIVPLLGRRALWVGHLGGSDLVDLVGRASVAAVSSVWDEPFGLVAAEAMACGTPVAAFARGGLTEVVADPAGRLARADDVDALSDALIEARRLDRRAVRRYAETHLGIDVMVDRYEQVYAGSEIRSAA